MVRLTYYTEFGDEARITYVMAYPRRARMLRRARPEPVVSP